MYAFHRISVSILGLSKWKLSFVWLKYWNYARFKEILFMNIIWKQKQVLPQTAIVVLGVKDNLSTRWSRQKYQSQENVFRNRRISRRWPSLERERTIIDRLFSIAMTFYNSCSHFFWQFMISNSSLNSMRV